MQQTRNVSQTHAEEATEVSYNYCGLSTGFRKQRVVFAGPPGDHITKVIQAAQTFYEVGLLDALAGHVDAKGKWILDVGAHCGNHSLYFALIMKARVIALEPRPETVRYLIQNVIRNDLAELVQVLPIGAGEICETRMCITPDAANIGGTYLRRYDASCRSDVVVDVKTVDSIVSSEVPDKSLVCIKIDVEGAQMDVLRGAIRTIEMHRPVLAVELASPQEREEVFAWFKAYNYKAVGPYAITPTYIFIPGGHKRRTVKRIAYLGKEVVTKAWQRLARSMRTHTKAR